MRCACNHFNRAGLLNGADRLCQRSARVNLVVNNHDALPLHVTDDVQHFGMIIIPFASLLDDRERCIKKFCKGARTLCETKVCHNGKVLGPLLPDVVGEHMHRGEFINGHVEESLELSLVKVHCEDSVCASNLQHVCHESGGDRHTWLIFLV